jgi:hypothetical protein
MTSMTSTNPQTIRRSPDSPAWITFTYVSFVAALGMVGTGIVLAPIDIGMKGYFAMGTLMLVQSCITLTKTIRDVQESAKLVNRIEDAKTDRLLMDIDRVKE